MSSLFPALQHRRFALFWAALLASNVGSAMQITAHSWLIYRMMAHDFRGLGMLWLSVSAAQIVGFSIGGVLLLMVGAANLFLINGMTYIPFLGVLFWLRVLDQKKRAGEGPGRQGFLPTLLEGPMLIVRNRSIRGLLLCSLVVGLFGRS